MDRVASRAQLQIVLGLKVETGIEVQRWAILVEFSTNPRTICKDQVDFVRSRHKSAPDCRHGDAFRALVLDPINLRHDQARLNRDAQNDLILHDNPGYGLTDGAGLRGKHAEQQRNQAQKCLRNHLVAHIAGAGFAAVH